MDNNPTDEAEPTNVLKTVCGIAPTDRDGIPQVVYYDAGVGTGGILDKCLGGLLGVGVSENIRQAYRFIANNYCDGDELFLFGFSRGAYTVRSLAGFIGSVGLLNKAHLRCVPEAYKLYRLPPSKRLNSLPWKRLQQLESEPRRIWIKYIGVWDTVGALGPPTPLLGKMVRPMVSFHDTQLGGDVQNAYHALAIDERRRPFQPDLWTGKPADGQTIEQVWFAGAHSNVGGSYRNTGLSNIALKWLTDRASQHGLEFTKQFAGLRPEPACRGRVEDSFTLLYKALRLFRVPPYTREIGTEQHGDIRDEDLVVPGEVVHPSAREAIGKEFEGNEGNETYGPRNLVAALENGLDEWQPTCPNRGT